MRSFFSYDTKEEMLWTTYKKRLVSFTPITVPDNLEELVTMIDNLEVLEVPFTHEEIDEVVKSLATDKTPGPNGFNNDFLKRCRSIIAPDFCALCEDFQKGKSAYKASMVHLSLYYLRWITPAALVITCPFHSLIIQ